MHSQFDAQVTLCEEDLPNFQVVAPELYRGGQPTRAGFERLKSLGVKTIVNLRDEHYAIYQEERLVRQMGLNYISIPLSPFETPPGKAIEHFLQSISHEPHQPLFVHCLHGMDRTGTMVSIYRLDAHDWTLDQAWEEMLEFGFHPHFTNLCTAVHQFAAKKRRQC